MHFELCNNAKLYCLAMTSIVSVTISFEHCHILLHKDLINSNLLLLLSVFCFYKILCQYSLIKD